MFLFGIEMKVDNQYRKRLEFGREIVGSLLVFCRNAGALDFYQKILKEQTKFDKTKSLLYLNMFRTFGMIGEILAYKSLPSFGRSDRDTLLAR